MLNSFKLKNKKNESGVISKPLQENIDDATFYKLVDEINSMLFYFQPATFSNGRAEAFLTARRNLLISRGISPEAFIMKAFQKGKEAIAIQTEQYMKERRQSK